MESRSATAVRRPLTRRPAAAVLGSLAAGLALAGCGSSPVTAGAGAEAGSDTAAGRIPVVASTNVWGDVVRSVGGDAVEVTSIISDPSQDPHSFEASTSTLLALSKARLVVQNGGGYDDFMARMTASSGSEAAVLTAVTVSGSSALEDGEPNEHVWYDLPSVQRMAGAVAARLAELSPDRAGQFRARAHRFQADVGRLVAEEARLRRQVAGERIGITEPVPLLLTEDCGLVDATPKAFSEAVEEGDDVSPAVLQETLDLYEQRKVAALVYNAQTSGPVTEKVMAAAEAAGLPVVAVTETLPEGVGYVAWMRDNLAHLRAALVRR